MNNITLAVIWLSASMLARGLGIDGVAYQAFQIVFFAVYALNWYQNRE